MTKFTKFADKNFGGIQDESNFKLDPKKVNPLQSYFTATKSTVPVASSKRLLTAMSKQARPSLGRGIVGAQRSRQDLVDEASLDMSAQKDATARSGVWNQLSGQQGALMSGAREMMPQSLAPSVRQQALSDRGDIYQGAVGEGLKNQLAVANMENQLNSDMLAKEKAGLLNKVGRDKASTDAYERQGRIYGGYMEGRR
jgi:Tfp pilus tip-associated adhesin PilY1